MNLPVLGGWKDIIQITDPKFLGVYAQMILDPTMLDRFRSDLNVEAHGIKLRYLIDENALDAEIVDRVADAADLITRMQEMWDNGEINSESHKYLQKGPPNTCLYWNGKIAYRSVFFQVGETLFWYPEFKLKGVLTRRLALQQMFFRPEEQVVDARFQKTYGRWRAMWASVARKCTPMDPDTFLHHFPSEEFYQDLLRRPAGFVKTDEPIENKGFLALQLGESRESLSIYDGPPGFEPEETIEDTLTVTGEGVLPV
eukprot:GHVL01033303.1.p1 GENE.GHVL01033303.1~~GHVL01033303.1.p1  ORF type:complete len:256 (-),score=5.26 GHVL01033303.1:151-918(-)